MKYPEVFPENRKTVPSEVYIDFLSNSIGATREEILEVIKRSGISARRIAEYLASKQLASRDNN
jgi:hypothetical protein